MMDLSKMTLKTLEGWQDHYRSGVRSLESELNAGYFLLQRVMDAIQAKRQAMLKDESDGSLVGSRDPLLGGRV